MQSANTSCGPGSVSDAVTLATNQATSIVTNRLSSTGTLERLE